MAGSIYEFNNIRTTEFKFLRSGMEFTDNSVLMVAEAFYGMNRTIYDISVYLLMFAPVWQYARDFRKT